MEGKEDLIEEFENQKFEEDAVTNLSNLISNLKDLRKVWRKTQNGGIAIREINHLMLRKYGTSSN